MPQQAIFYNAVCLYHVSQIGVKMTDHTAEDLAFLIKIGQIKETPSAPKPVTKKDEE